MAKMTKTVPQRNMKIEEPVKRIETYLDNDDIKIPILNLQVRSGFGQNEQQVRTVWEAILSHQFPPHDNFLILQDTHVVAEHATHAIFKNYTFLTVNYKHAEYERCSFMWEIATRQLRWMMTSAQRLKSPDVKGGKVYGAVVLGSCIRFYMMDLERAQDELLYYHFRPYIMSMGMKYCLHVMDDHVEIQWILDRILEDNLSSSFDFSSIQWE